MITRENIDIRVYREIHYWLKKNYGRATKCENKDCDGVSKRFSWALKRGLRYRKRRKSFVQLCRKCHSLMDITDEFRKKRSIAMQGKSLPPEIYDKLRKKLTGAPRTKDVRARISATRKLKYESKCLKCKNITQSRQKICLKCYMKEYHKKYYQQNKGRWT